jgi:hypothetical protein
MDFCNQSDPTTRKAVTAPIRDTYIPLKMLPVCCVCSLIRDEIGPFPVRERWVTSRTYRMTHGINPPEFPRTHTYCPACFKRAQATTQHFGEIGM